MVNRIPRLRKVIKIGFAAGLPGVGPWALTDAVA